MQVFLQHLLPAPLELSDDIMFGPYFSDIIIFFFANSSNLVFIFFLRFSSFIAGTVTFQSNSLSLNQVEDCLGLGSGLSCLYKPTQSSTWFKDKGLDWNVTIPAIKDENLKKKMKTSKA